MRARDEERPGNWSGPRCFPPTAHRTVALPAEMWTRILNLIDVRGFSSLLQSCTLFAAMANNTEIDASIFRHNCTDLVWDLVGTFFAAQHTRENSVCFIY